MFFDGWHGILRILVVGTLSYALLIFMLRISGKRTLSKMSAFDLIITISLGSTLATVILSKDVVLLEGLTALALLVLLQWIVSKLAVYSSGFADLIHAEPSMLLHNGRFLEQAMQESRITKKEIEQALRKEGLDRPDQAQAVILETNGRLTVIPG